MITLNFTEQQLSVIDRALAQMPYGQVAPIIADINKQLQANPPDVEMAPGDNHDLMRG